MVVVVENSSAAGSGNGGFVCTAYPIHPSIHPSIHTQTTTESKTKTHGDDTATGCPVELAEAEEGQMRRGGRRREREWTAQSHMDRYRTTSLFLFLPLSPSLSTYLHICIYEDNNQAQPSAACDSAATAGCASSRMCVPSDALCLHYYLYDDDVLLSPVNTYSTVHIISAAFH